MHRLGPTHRSVSRFWRRGRGQTGFLLQPSYDRPQGECTLCAAVISTRAVFEWEEPVKYAMAHDLLQVLQVAAKVERVFAWEGVKDGKDVALVAGGVGGLGLRW